MGRDKSNIRFISVYVFINPILTYEGSHTMTHKALAECTSRKLFKLSTSRIILVFHMHVSLYNYYNLLRGEPCKNEMFWAYSDPWGFQG